MSPLLWCKGGSRPSEPSRDTLPLPHCSACIHDIFLPWGPTISSCLFYVRYWKMLCMITLFTGVPRPDSSYILGSCPLPLYLRCNCCLRSAAYPDPVLEGGVQRARGGERSREKSPDYWQANASSILLSLSPLQHIVLASLPLRTKVNIKRCICEIVLLLHRRKSTPLQHIILARLPLWSKVMHWQNNTGCIWKEWHCVFYLLKYIFWRLFSISCDCSSLPWSCCQGLSWERIAFYSAPCSYD